MITVNQAKEIFEQFLPPFTEEGLIKIMDTSNFERPSFEFFIVILHISS